MHEKHEIVWSVQERPWQQRYNTLHMDVTLAALFLEYCFHFVLALSFSLYFVFA